MGEASRSPGEAFDWNREAASLLSILRDAVIVAHAADNVIVGWNAAAETIFEYTAEEAIGMSVSELAPEHLRARHEAGLTRYAETGEGYFLDHHDPLVLPALTKTGKEITVEFQLTPLREPHDGRLYAAAIVRDVTERINEQEATRTIQEKRAASQRLEAVGQLATGVAHDFNNLLTVILAEIHFVIDSKDIDRARRDALESVMEAAERGGALSRQLLAFSRKSLVTPSAVSMNDAVTSAAQFLGRTLGDDIELVLQLEPTLPRTMMDPAQVDQVLTNLALNARDAMPNGGLMTITTDLVRVSDESLWSADSEVPHGSYVRLVVTDTGVGMEDSVRVRIFEPFFTTKPRERGTGMGLAMVYGIVRQANGYIYCESSPDQGTRFEILLPLASVTPEAAEEPDTDRTIVPTFESAKILLLDDDPFLLRSAKRILERSGHRVTDLDAPVEALRLGEAGHRFDLLITDMVMPGMNGAEVAHALRAAGAVTAVLLVSGYPEGVTSLDETLKEGSTSFLPKPFRGNQLLQSVQELLKGTSDQSSG